MSTIYRYVLPALLLGALTAGLMSPRARAAVTIESLQAQIQALLTQIATLQTQVLALQSGNTAASPQQVPASCAFTRNLYLGISGNDVTCLQTYLNAAGFRVAASGPGSPGNETVYYGALTKSAVEKWQVSYTIAPAAGYFGPLSRAMYVKLTASTPLATPPSAPPAIGGSEPLPTAWNGLLVVSPVQPAPTLAPQGAARVPFTQIQLSASSEKDIVVTQIIAERRGLASSAAFASVSLIDEQGIQIGNARTINANNQIVFNERFTVPAGTTRIVTVAANMASSLSPYAGQIARFAVVSVATAQSQVTGELPVVGHGMTVNATLPLGSLTFSHGLIDPAAAQTKEVSTKKNVFSAIRAASGSVEDVVVESVTWTQTGSAAVQDLENVFTVINGTRYPVVISENGKRYTSLFPAGIRITQGRTTDIHIEGDIIGGSARTVDFDIDRRVDIAARGATYGYYILPADGTATSGTDDSRFHSGTTPWYDASETTIGTGTLRIESTSAFVSGDVSESAEKQTIAAFQFSASGEPITITQLSFAVDVTGSGSTNDITSVVVTTSEGGVFAGPVDAKASPASQDGTITFTDTFDIPAGDTLVFLKGAIGAGFAEGDTVVITITPSAGIARGATTDISITPSPSVSVRGGSLTVKTGSLALITMPTPVSQNIVRGGQNISFATLRLDATASGEPIRVTSLSLTNTPAASANTNNLTNCRVFENDTALTFGSNVVQPSSSSASASFLFRLNTPLTVLRGTARTLTLACTVSSNAADNSTHTWKINTDTSAHGITGATSGKTVTPSVTGTGQTMTMKEKGALSVILDSSNPPYRIVAANISDTTIAVLKFTARDEAVRLTQLGVQLTDALASTPRAITRATIWDNTTRVGEVVFTGNYATSTISNLIIPKDSEKKITIKADLSPIGTSQAGVQGSLVKIDYDGDAADSAGSATRGIGLASGTTIFASTSDTSASGVRVFKGYPSIAAVTTGLDSRYGSSGSDVPLYRFSITANTHDVSIYKFTFRVATSSSPASTGTSVTNLRVYGYTTSSFTGPVGPWQNGQLNATLSSIAGIGSSDVNVYVNGTGSPTDQRLIIPKGMTYYFDVRGDIAVTGSPTSGSIRTYLAGDSAYPAIATLMGTAAIIDADAQNNFIWSPNATTDSLTTAQDWTNGFRVDGIPSTGLTAWTMTK